MGRIRGGVEKRAQQYSGNHVNMMEAQVDYRILIGTKAEFSFM